MEPKNQPMPPKKISFLSLILDLREVARNLEKLAEKSKKQPKEEK